MLACQGCGSSEVDARTVDAAATDAPEPDASPIDGRTADAAVDATPPDLPAPADNTAELTLNGVRHTLTSRLFCRDGSTGVGFQRSDDPNNRLPTLFLHSVDFAAAGDILIMTNAAWHLDMDEVGAVWGTTQNGCPARIVESSPTRFELSAFDCDIKNQFGLQTGTASFRLRCTKGT